MGINPLPLQGTNQPSTRAKEGWAPANSYHQKEQTGTHPTPIHPTLTTGWVHAIPRSAGWWWKGAPQQAQGQPIPHPGKGIPPLLSGTHKSNYREFGGDGGYFGTPPCS